MFKKGLIYEKVDETKPNEIINAINGARTQISAKNIIVVVEEEYYYFITYNDSIVQGTSYVGMDVLVRGIRKEKIAFEKIRRIYFVDVNVGNPESIYNQIKDKCGLEGLELKF